MINGRKCQLCHSVLPKLTICQQWPPNGPPRNYDSYTSLLPLTMVQQNYFLLDQQCFRIVGPPLVHYCHVNQPFPHGFHNLPTIAQLSLLVGCTPLVSQRMSKWYYFFFHEFFLLQQSIALQEFQSWIFFRCVDHSYTRIHQYLIS